MSLWWEITKTSRIGNSNETFMFPTCFTEWVVAVYAQPGCVRRGLISINPMRDTKVASTWTTRNLDYLYSTSKGTCLQAVLVAQGCIDSLHPLRELLWGVDCPLLRTPGGWCVSERSTWPAACCPHPGLGLRDFAILPQELWGFILCAEDHVSADVLISDRGCLSGRGFDRRHGSHAWVPSTWLTNNND